MSSVTPDHTRKKKKEKGLKKGLNWKQQQQTNDQKKNPS